MKIEIIEVDEIKLVPENDSDKALINYWSNNYFLITDGVTEFQKLEDIKNINNLVRKSKQ